MIMSYLHLNFPNSEMIEVFKYPAGESQVRIKKEFLGLFKQANVVDITARPRTGDEIIQLVLCLDAINAVLEEFASINLHFPYLPYGRADRRFCEGDCAGIEVFLKLIWETSKIEEITSLDIHTNRELPTWMRIRNISPLPHIERALLHHARGKKGITILFPDEGARNRYTLPIKLGNNLSTLSLEILYCEKKRNPVDGKLEGFKVPSSLKYDRVLIVDDICDGGGTFLGIADQLEISRERLGLYVTHGIFSNGTEELLKRFQVIYTTDSWEQTCPEVIVV